MEHALYGTLYFEGQFHAILCGLTFHEQRHILPSMIEVFHHAEFVRLDADLGKPISATVELQDASEHPGSS